MRSSNLVPYPVHESRSTLSTYLTTVVHRLLLDYRTRRWGKWRPAARSRRLGELAVALDRLVNRDGHPLDQAVAILRSRMRAELSPEDLIDLGQWLTRRPRPRFEDVEILYRIAVDGGVEGRLLRREKAATTKRVRAALAKALSTLSGEDRLLLKMRYADGFTIPQIAAALHVAARPLYGRFEKCLARVRAVAEQEGITSSDVKAILGSEGAERAPGLPPCELLGGLGRARSLC